MNNLIITGRRWFERTNGNTYFSSRAYLDGELIHTIDFEYGYGDHYKDATLRDLEEKQLIPKRQWKLRQIAGCDPMPEPSEAWWQWSERTGITITSEVTDVSRKKDL